MDKDAETSSEKRALLEHDDVERDVDTVDGNVVCCHAGSTPYRYAVLAFLCLTGVGDYFILDNPAALEDHILTDLNLNVTNYMLFYSVLQWVRIPMFFLSGYLIDKLIGNRRAMLSGCVAITFTQWCQLAACLVSGYLIDKVLGNRWGMLTGCLVVTVSQAVFALGASVNSFWVMCLGRMLFGIVEAVFGIAQNNICVRWFKSKELNMVLGLKTSIARAGSVIQMNVMGPIYNYMSRYFEGHSALAMSLYVGAGICLLSALCAVVLFFLDKKGDNYSLNKELLNTTRNDVRISDIKEFPVTFWLMSLVISCYYWSVFTFVGLGVVYFEMKYEQEPAVAANINSLAYLISIFVMPFSGWLIDRYGRSLYWLYLGLILGLLSHILLAFTFINPYVPISILGVSYSVTTATVWPTIPYMVDLKYCATGFGIMNAIIAVGQSGITYLAGYLTDNRGYLVVEVLFITGICASLIFTSLIYLIDKRRDGILNLSVKERTFRASRAKIHQEEVKAAESQQ